MKLFALLSLCTVTAAYTDIDDTVSYENIVSHPNELQDLFDCFVDKKPCDDNGAHIKRHLLDAIQHGCAACDEAQKHAAHLGCFTMKKTHPEEYKLFKAKYDPDGTKLAAFEKEIEKF